MPSIIPGGESTTITRLLDIYELREPIRRLGQDGLPIWGTCAGAIVLAKQATDLDRPNLALMDIDVRRNAFGRQVDSFEEDLRIDGLEGPPFHAIFIRAPRIDRAGPGVQVLASLPDGTIVAAREGPLLATSFHPELTGDRAIPQPARGLAASTPHDRGRRRSGRLRAADNQRASIVWNLVQSKNARFAGIQRLNQGDPRPDRPEPPLRQRIQ